MSHRLQLPYALEAVRQGRFAACRPGAPPAQRSFGRPRAAIMPLGVHHLRSGARMSWDFLQFHEPDAATWFYLSLAAAVAVYVRFNRLWSLRNWDVLSLFLIVPGLLAAGEVERWMREAPPPAVADESASAQAPAPPPPSEAERLQENPERLQLHRFSYIWLFAVAGYFLFRCLLDFALVRRPRLDANLSAGGLVFLAVCLFSYLALSVLTRDPDANARADAHVASALVRGETRPERAAGADPATVLFMLPAAAAHRVIAGANPDALPSDQSQVEDGVVRSALLLCHLLLMTALLIVGWRHFQSPAAGVAMVLLYLLLPVSFLHVMKLDHVIPAMLLTWAVVCYQAPLLSGALLALASVSFFPLFLLPAWLGFYWRDGAKRFAASFLATTALLWTTVYFVPSLLSFFELWTQSLSSKVLISSESAAHSIGFWTPATQIYRLPIVIVFAILVVGAFFIPKRKTLADLIAASAAVLLGVQFWWADRGGAFIHWYLPFLLLLIFRPNLSEAVAPKAPAAPSPAPA
jgi:hypothetical protein